MSLLAPTQDAMTQTTPPSHSSSSGRVGTGPRWLLLLLTLFLAAPVFAQEKRPLDHDAYDVWNRIQQSGLSADGRWLHYRLTPGHGDATLVVREVSGEGSHEIERGQNPTFTRDGAFLVFRIAPTLEAREEARSNRNTPMPRDSLGILEVATGEIRRISRLKAFTVPDESREWVVIHREAPRNGEEAEDETPEAEPAEPGTEPEPPEPEEEDEASAPDRDRDTGTDLHYLNLRTGEERVFRGVTEYRVHEDGSLLVFAVQSRDGNGGDGIHLVRAHASEAVPVLLGMGEYQRLTLDREGEQVAFLSNRDAWNGEDDEPLFSLFHAPLDGSEARTVASAGVDGLPTHWQVSTNGAVSFSHDGSRLFFGTAPPPPPEADEDDPMLQNVQVDIWNWRDDFLQPHQLRDLNQERRRTYQAVFHRDEARVVQLAHESMLQVQVGSRGDAGVALGTDDQPHRQIVSWDTRFTNHYLVDPRTGERERIATKLRSTANLSPASRYVFWWDGGDFEGTLPRGWMVMDLETREVVNVTEAIPFPVYNELSDRTAPPGSYGLAGWTENDGYLLVHDAWDIWRVDPHGREAPVNLTAGYGRDHQVRLRVVRLELDEPFLPLDEDILLSAFNNSSKAAGYYRTRLDGSRVPEALVMDDVAFGSLEVARDADVKLFTKRTFEMFPDLWVSDRDFQGQRRLTDANPQQAEYLWGSAELVSWTSTDGEELQGILYKPENFDPNEEWPMMVYFYERSSNGLHNYFVPSTGTSINRSFYVSRGYVLFVPDIPYKPGYPGESAMNAIIPGVLSIVDQGYIDRNRIGVQGHSWGGYQIAYMITRTNLFAAAEAGAPVTNMTSAYGGIRWASGRVRQMQYETGQSRIGASLWEAQHRYIENSPLFTAYKVETPLLMVHNDEDGAVPWEEGIQFFVALRRLGKPVWLINYNGQGHGVSGRYPQLDWSIRMQQFFDHYLQGAAPPVWMVDGVPALAKGRTLGLELVEDDPVADADDRNDGSQDRDEER
ncbi:MAG: S9 family peptidase [Gemmatimonadales bacterium]|nr:MAG: S9 family peptidase [Gemmatimonadales bacterium]